MGRAKDIVMRVIPSAIANAFVKKWHYSGKVVNNSTLHFGAFLDGRLHGVMSFGSPMDKRKVLPLVHNADGKPCLWNEMLELNRMAFDEYLPKNSESRCISIAVKLLRKNAPHIKWLLSFSDGTQCGDGAIYRASGFVLTGIKQNRQIIELPDGFKVPQSTLTRTGKNGGEKVKSDVNRRISQFTLTKSKNIFETGAASVKPLFEAGAKWLPGFQLRYIYLIDKSCRINTAILPFSKIDELNAGMYRGEKITIAERQQYAAVAHTGERRATSPEGAFDSTAPLKSTEKAVNGK